VKAYLGLGSNLGDRWEHLRHAVGGLLEIDPDLSVSPVYETAPVGGPEQGPYLNCVVRIETELDPFALLALAHRLETAAGRLRTVKDGPRTLDVDVLVIEGVVLAGAELTVPHPRMTERGFVLAPLEDIEPTLVPDGWRSRLPGAATLASDVRRIGTLELNPS
jgi:2-amino-4-hydroxy-6-hydroxymethyldihydropteridine diphosphokinase